MTTDTDEAMVAYALEVDPTLLEFVPELLADLEVLGADAVAIVAALRELGVTSESTVIDLGCGKGGVAVAIAAALECRVVGIDLFEPFVRAASAAAEQAGVARHCHFVHGGIVDLTESLTPADAVVYAALGDVLGPLDDTITIIRQYAKQGGHVLVNDSYLRDATAERFPGFERYAELDETRRRLTACGDELVLEHVVADDDGPAGDQDEAALIAARADELAARHPHLATAFLEFASTQAEEYDYLAEHTVSAVWAVRRS